MTGGCYELKVLPLMRQHLLFIRSGRTSYYFTNVSTACASRRPLIYIASIADLSRVSVLILPIVSGATKESCEWLRGVLGDGAPPPLRLRPVKPCGAAVSGKPFGGLVSRFPVLLGKGLLPSFEGRVVFMECTPRYAGVSESILDGLAAKGLFDKAAAVVFCDFNREWEKPRVDALFAAFAAKVKCPVFAGFPYGHIPGSFAIDFTRPLSISADGVLEWKARGK